MTSVFPPAALYDALDAERHARGMSWQEVARQIGAVSVSTLAGMRTRSIVEGDGVLQMLRWLGRTPESFIPGHQAAPNEVLPFAEPGQLLRFDTQKLYEALDAQRATRGWTWRQVADDIGGMAVSSLTRLKKGGRTAFPDVLRLAQWLRRPVASFVRVVLR